MCYQLKLGQHARECRTLCNYFGKREDCEAVSTMLQTKPADKALLQVTDQAMGETYRYLGDTSATVSIIPPATRDELSFQPVYDLLATNNTPIATRGTHLLALELSFTIPLVWPFIMVDITMPITGYDFLSHHKMIIEASHNQPKHAPTSTSVSGTVTQGNPASISTIENDKGFQGILQQYPELMSPTAPATFQSREVYHHTEMTSPLVFARP